MYKNEGAYVINEISVEEADKGVGSEEVTEDFSWKMKLGVAMLVDTFDMTIGRLLFPTPFLGEIVGTTVCWLMFGPKALWYSWELLDPTEQLDGFVPTATMIALMARDD